MAEITLSAVNAINDNTYVLSVDGSAITVSFDDLKNIRYMINRAEYERTIKNWFKYEHGCVDIADNEPLIRRMVNTYAELSDDIILYDIEVLCDNAKIMREIERNFETELKAYGIAPST